MTATSTAPTGPAFDLDYARNAYRHISMSPDRRAEQERRDFVAHLDGVAARLSPLATTDEMRAYLGGALVEYTTGYRRHVYRVLAAKSRTASTMITGPANFPTRRNEKALATERRRSDELVEWAKRAEQNIRAALLALRSDDDVAAERWQELRRIIDRDMATVAGIDRKDDRVRGFDRSAFVVSVVGRIRRLAANGDHDLARRALVYIAERQAGWAKPYIAPRNGVWALRDQAAIVEPPKATGVEVVAQRPGVVARRDHDIHRLQLVFDAKPDEATREFLRATGWRWSPVMGAWQRQPTVNADHALGRFLDFIDQRAEG